MPKHIYSEASFSILQTSHLSEVNLISDTATFANILRHYRHILTLLLTLCNKSPNVCIVTGNQLEIALSPRTAGDKARD